MQLPMSYATRCKTGGSPMTSSAHWGELRLPVPADQVRVAHHLIDGGIDLVSSWRAYCRGGAGF
jgi:poly-gamma-glutamate capsule biosynthesis protein CapA/YwtB (metallophosphatase superfamily)